jgi:hypothetical protein
VVVSSEKTSNLCVRITHESYVRETLAEGLRVVDPGNALANPRRVVYSLRKSPRLICLSPSKRRAQQKKYKARVSV